MKKQIKSPKLEMYLQFEARLKIIYWFFAYPNTPIGLNDLSKAVRVSKKMAKLIVEQLVDEQFLNLEVIGKSWRISCNNYHPFNTTIKIPFNLTLVQTSGILESVLEIIPNPRAVILFGSYRKGDDTEKSDIDIAVEVLGNQGLDIKNLGNIPNMGYRTNVSVNIHIFSRIKIDLNLFANIANGIVLLGFLEVRP